MSVPSHQLLELGEVLEVRLKSGKYAYCQNINNNDPMPLARTLRGVFESPLPGEDLITLCADGSQFVAQFPLKVLITNQHARSVAVLDIPPSLRRRPPIRHWTSVSEHNPDGWFIMDEETGSFGGAEYTARFPDVDQRSLPVNRIPGIGLFLRLIDAKWDPRMAANGSFGIDPVDDGVSAEARRSTETATNYLCLFRRRTDARSAIDEFRVGGLAARLTRTPQEQWGWSVAATIAGPFDLERDAWVHDVASRLGGVCDGSEFGPI